MKIKGWLRTSLIDYPDHIASVIFTGGCNFRCPMCHNSDLVLDPDQLPDIEPQEVIDFLVKRSGLVDGLVITGGEPTIQPHLIDFIARVKDCGIEIKLDTNGYRPDILKTILDEKLVDYVAVDIKAPPDKYVLLSGRPDLDIANIEKSVQLLKKSTLPYEFRTTVVPGMLTQTDIELIAEWIKGAEYYCLQQFRAINNLDPELNKLSPYSVFKLQQMAERARKWVKNVLIR